MEAITALPGCCLGGGTSTYRSTTVYRPSSYRSYRQNTTVINHYYGHDYGGYDPTSILTHPAYACYPGNIYNGTLCPSSDSGGDSGMNLPGFDPLWIVLAIIAAAMAVVGAIAWANR
jgi:hypothetical protein